MTIKEAATMRTKNRAFGPGAFGRSKPLMPPSYRNPSERGKRFVSKGRQRPAVNYGGESVRSSRAPNLGPRRGTTVV